MSNATKTVQTGVRQLFLKCFCTHTKIQYRICNKKDENKWRGNLNKTREEIRFPHKIQA